tara:strand:- start:2093 stop:2527 length:435 start_codon:yes stop_codon:yes gene_type:complete
MGKKRTEKSRYPSRYSPQGWVHAGQYVTELICEKKAKTENKELPIKFWELPEWLKYYKYQIMLANKLIKEYGEHSVIAALNDKRMWKTYSLRSPFLKDVIKEYKEKEEIAKSIAKKIEYDFSKKEKFDSNNNKKSILDKLEGLE